MLRGAVANGAGKGWSKGKTAATDERVARNAERHRGKAYMRRTPLELCRWPSAARLRVPVGWSRELAYVVGLIASDGCLISVPRRIDFVSTDLQLVETYLDCLERPRKFRTQRTARGSLLYRVEIKDAQLYRWLLDIGLTPRKSLTLGALAVPDEYIMHVVRGLLDGDGSILNFVSAADTTRRPDRSYMYEWFRVRSISASRDHLVWLQDRIRSSCGIAGAIATFERRGYTTMHRLEFGRWDSMRLLSWIYADRSAPCLPRKRAIWDHYAARYAVDVAEA